MYELMLVGGSFALWIFILGGVGRFIGELGNKGNGKIGFLLGVLLGPLGWLIVALIPAAEGQPGSPSQVASAKHAEALRIARLEGELAALKRMQAPPVSTPVSGPKPSPFDKEPDVYKLD